MHKRHLLYSILFAATSLLIVGCKSTKNITNSSNAVINSITSKAITTNGLRSKINVAIMTDSKLSASGTLKMKRDEIIQISLSAIMGMMEIGRLELTPEYLLIQDRINHQYIKSSWDNIPYLSATHADFYTFQSLFWNDVFVPGKKTPEVNDFEIGMREGFCVLNQAKANNDILLTFLVNATSGLLEQTSLSSMTKAPEARIDWNYGEWSTLNGQSFPTQMLMTIHSGKGDLAAQFTLSRLQSDENMGNLNTTIDTNRYKQVDINQIIRKLAY